MGMKTAMQILLEELRNREERNKGNDLALAYGYAADEAEELIEKEKQQIIDANMAGRRDGYNGISHDMSDAEQYYNSTFKQD